MFLRTKHLATLENTNPPPPPTMKQLTTYGNTFFNDALNTFYLRLYDAGILTT